MTDNSKQPPKESKPVSLRSSTLQTLVRPGALGKASASGTVRPSPKTGGAAKAGAKAKSTFTFTPHAIRQTGKVAALPKAVTLPVQTGGATSIQNLLAQQLAVGQRSDGPRATVKMGPLSNRIVSAVPQSNKLQQYEIMRRKKRDSNKSRDILELSWAPEGKENDAIYTPISLPYVIREDEQEATIQSTKQTDVGDMAKVKSQRPSMKHVDEANQNAAVLFNTDESLDDVNQWMLVQMPSLLPALNVAAMSLQAEKIEESIMSPEDLEKKRKAKERDQRRAQSRLRVDNEKYIPLKLSEMPEGRLGKILVRQSGKAQLVIGEHVFDINAGSECAFAQDVGCFLEDTSEFVFLGKCMKRMNVIPDVERLIRESRATQD